MSQRIQTVDSEVQKEPDPEPTKSQGELNGQLPQTKGMKGQWSLKPTERAFDSTECQMLVQTQ